MKKEYPETFEIGTSIGCPNDCKYCPQDKLIKAYGGRKRFLSLEDFKTCMDKVPVRDINIHFAGMSEPFINKDCSKMIKYAHDRGFKKIDVFTTGIGMNEEDIRVLEKIPLVYFELHLPDDKGLTKIKVDDNYLDIIKKIKVSKIPNIHYQVFGNLHPRVKEALGFEVEDLTRILQNRAGNLEDTFSMKVNNFKGKIECRTYKTDMKTMGLLPNGEVILCCMDYSLKHIIGNLLTQSYEEIFQSEEYKRIVRGLDDPSIDIICRQCPYARERDTIFQRTRNKFDDSKLKRDLYKFYKGFKK